MKNKQNMLILTLSSLLLFNITLGNAKAQLDLKKLSEKKVGTKEESITKEDYFNYIKEQILNGKSNPLTDIPADKYPVPEKYVKTFGGEKWANAKDMIRDILKNEYKMSISDKCRTQGLSCYEMIFKRMNRVMGDLAKFYYRTITRKDSGKSEKESLAHNIDQLKGWMKNNAKRWGGTNELAKVMKFIDDYNNLLASAYKEAKSKTEKKILEKKKVQEEQKTFEEQKERERLASQKAEAEKRYKERLIAEQKAKEGIKQKIDPIVEYAMKNRAKLEKESKSFRKDVSGVWYADQDYFTIDLFSPNKIISINNNKPFPVQIGKYDKDNKYIIVYIIKNGKISTGGDGKPSGLVIRMVRIGGREFKVGISMTDGIENGPEKIFGFVRDLKR